MEKPSPVKYESTGDGGGDAGAAATAGCGEDGPVIG